MDLLLAPARLKNQSPDQQQSVIFQYLYSLESSLQALSTPEMKAQQVALEKQLTELMTLHKPGPPVRRLIARCFRAIYQKGDSRSLFDNITSFLGTAKGSGKNPEPLPRMAAIHVVGALTEAYGKQLSSLFPDIVQGLLKLSKAEGQIRAEITFALASGIKGVGKAASESVYKDILKYARSGMSDKFLPVRMASVRCLQSLIQHADAALLAGDFDNIVSSCFKAFDGSNYSLRIAVADLLGRFLSGTQNQPETTTRRRKIMRKKSFNNMPVDDMLAILANGFIKSGGEKAVRVGIAEAYGALFRHLGARWTQANCKAIIFHVVNLASHAKTSTTPSEEANSRECFGYILKCALEKLLNEESQLNAIKELVSVLKLYPPAAPTEPGPSPQALVVVLHQISDLFQILGSALKPLQETVFDPLLGVSGHPSFSVRQAAAWSFRALGLATPAHLSKYLTQLIQLTKASHSKLSPDRPETLGRLRGHAICLAALVACIPHCLLHVSFSIPEEILSMAVKIGAENPSDPSLRLVCQEVSWTLLASLTCLGSGFIKPHQSKYFSLFQVVFSKNSKDASMTDEIWKNTVRARECALACLEYFLKNCFSLISVELSKKVTNYLNSSLVFLALVPSNKISDTILKMRLFQCFLALPASSYELSHVPLLRSVAEILTNPNSGETPNSLFYTQSNRQDATLFGWNFESDEEQAEKQLQFPLSGALEYDPHIVCGFHARDTLRPSPVPPEIAVIDSGIRLFEKIFPIQQHQTQEQLLEQFVKAFKQVKSGPKKLCLQINVFTALMGALKTLMVRKSSLSRGKVSALLQELVQGALVQNDGTLRYAAAETLGRLSGVVGGQFVSSLVKSLLDNLINQPEPTAKAGYLLALGCVMRYVGGMGASSHLQAAVGILHSLSSDPNPLIATWAIHSLWIAIDSAGLMFQRFVNSTLTLVVKLFLSDSFESPSEKEHLPDLNISNGRLLSSLIVALGPELQTDKTTRDLCLSIYTELENDRDQAVVAEAVRCVQQLLIFAPSSVDISQIVPLIQSKISFSSFAIRKACFVCLRQLIQRDPKGVIAAGNSLEEQLFGSFDKETSPELHNFLMEMIHELLAATALSAPSRWVDMTKQILSNTAASKGEEGEKEDQAEEEPEPEEGEDGDEGEDGEPPSRERSKSTNGAKPGAPAPEKPKYRLTPTPRWQTKMVAIQCVRRMMELISASKPALARVHMTLGPARELRHQGGGKPDLLVLRLGDLIKIAFNGATSPIEELSLCGLDCLQTLIEKFAPGEDPDYEEHSILEQYQAQVSAALRPAFSPENSPEILSKACAVTSIYLSGGVMAETSDLKRVATLLTSMMEKFIDQPSLQKPAEGALNLSPHAHQIVKIAVLTAWADLYVSKDSKPQLEEIVMPYLPSLSKLWVSALCEYAEIKVGKTPSAIREAVLPYFRDTWIKILEAVSILDERRLSSALQNMEGEEGDTSRAFFIIFALCTEALFEAERAQVSRLCLLALEKLLKPWLVGDTFFEKEYFVELLFVLNRIVQTDEMGLYIPVVKLIKQIINDHSTVLFAPRPALFGQASRDSSSNDALLQNIVRILTNLFLRHIPEASSELKLTVPPSRVEGEAAFRIVNLTMEAFSQLISFAPQSHQSDLAPLYCFFLKSVLESGSQAIRANCSASSLQSIRSSVSKISAEGEADARAASGPSVLSQALQRVVLSFLAKIQTETPRLTQGREAVDTISNLLLASVLMCTSAPLLTITMDTLNAHVQAITLVFATRNEEISLVGLQCTRSLIQLMARPETASFGRAFAKALVPEVICLMAHPGQSEKLTSEAIKVLVSVAVCSPEAQKQGVYAVIIPAVVSLLKPDSPTPGHHACLQQLLQIGKDSPAHFKEAVGGLAPSMKERLELSIRLAATATATATAASSPSTSSSSAAARQQQQPTIQLKMSFGNFS